MTLNEGQNPPTISRRAFFSRVGYTPHKGQEQIHAARSNPAVKIAVVACGARFGKTWAAAYEMAFEAILPRKDFLGWCVAPTHDLAHIVFDELIQVLRKFYRGKIRVDSNGGEIELTNLGGGRSRIFRMSTDKAQDSARLVGYPCDFMILDEASAIEPDSIWYNQLSTRLIDRGGRVLMISTPRGTGGFFAKLFRVGQTKTDPSIVSIQLPSWTNPHGQVRASMAQERKNKSKRDFMQEYAAEFISTDGLVYQHEDVAAISNGDFEGFDPRYEYYGGLDLAVRQDYTVLMIVRAPRPDVLRDTAAIVYVHRMHRMPVERQIDEIKAITDSYGECSLYVDATGLGVPICQQMLNAGLYIRPVVWTHASKGDMVKNSLILVERHAIVLPRPHLCPAFQEELAVYGWHATESGMQQTTRAPSGLNDDCIAAFVLACRWIRAGGTAPRDHSEEQKPPPQVPRKRIMGQPKGLPGSFQVGGEAIPEAGGFTPNRQEGSPKGRFGGFGLGNSLFGGI